MIQRPTKPTLNNTKVENILACYNFYNSNGEQKFNCHAQIYGPINEEMEICKLLCEKLRRARKYDKGWVQWNWIGENGKDLGFRVRNFNKDTLPSNLLRYIYDPF